MDFKKISLNREHKKKLLLILRALAVIMLLYIGFLQWKIVQYSFMKTPNHADYLFILGASVKGTIPSSVLQSRINTAAIYLKENPKTIAIASGGKGSGENISEAEAIKNGLMEKGISQSRIILENHSTNTYENIQFSKRLLPQSAKTGVIVTNQFHLYRSLMLARDQHLNVYGMAAPTPLSAVPKSYLREYLAITKYYLFKT